MGFRQSNPQAGGPGHYSRDPRDGQFYLCSGSEEISMLPATMSS